MLLVRYGDIIAYNNAERVFAMGAMVVGVTIFGCDYTPVDRCSAQQVTKYPMGIESNDRHRHRFLLTSISRTTFRYTICKVAVNMSAGEPYDTFKEFKIS